MAFSKAPDRLEIVRSFVNTVEIEDGTDPLEDSGRLREWCAVTGLCAGDNETQLARLRGFREALRSVLAAHAGEEDKAKAWRRLQPYAEAACYRLRLDESGLPALEPQGWGADAAIAEIFAIAYDAIGAGTWRRLKACRKLSCRWAFYDRSKNGSGAWCSMRLCGNRAKAQRRRARQNSE